MEVLGTPEKEGKPGANRACGAKSLMGKTSQSDCWRANEAESAPSFLGEGRGVGTAHRWRISLKFSLGVLSLSSFLGGCGADAPKPAAQAGTKPAEPVVPEEIQLAAKALLGSESQVLAFGDLAKNGKQEFLAANVVPKTPTNNLPGTIVTRVVVAENTDGKWAEVLRCDEHLKNQKGFLGLTPLAISRWSGATSISCWSHRQCKMRGRRCDERGPTSRR
ncbi:MAG: hypothetical protein DMG51_03975 [Acidobacteria bacterium]|nr:MAG: hypothetical protein DMG51_03975 [Acidobacteriota bacterium]